MAELQGEHKVIHQRETQVKPPRANRPPSRSPPPARAPVTAAVEVPKEPKEEKTAPTRPRRRSTSRSRPAVAGQERVPTKAEELVDFVLDPTRDEHLPEPYHKLGNPRMYTQENLEKRQALRSHEAVLRSIDGFRRLFNVDEKGFVPKEDYFKIHAKMSRMLRPELSDEEAAELAEQDWQSDTKNSNGKLHSDALRNILFDFVDIWTWTVNPTEYMMFLDTLYFKLTGVEGTLGGTLPTNRQRSNSRSGYRASMASVSA